MVINLAMHFGQILDDCLSPSGHDMDDFTDWEDLINAFDPFYVPTDNQLELMTHMMGPFIITYVMEAFKKFVRMLSRKNKQSAKQNSLIIVWIFLILFFYEYVTLGLFSL